MRKTAGYTWTGHKPNTQFAKQLNTTPVLVRKQECRSNCLQYTNRMQLKITENNKTTGQQVKETRGDH